MHEDLPKRLLALLAHHSGAPESTLDGRSTPDTTPGWDSVANLALMAAIEEEFGVTIATRDAIKMKSLGDIQAYLESNAGKESQ